MYQSLLYIKKKIQPLHPQIYASLKYSVKVVCPLDIGIGTEKVKEGR